MAQYNNLFFSFLNKWLFDHTLLPNSNISLASRCLSFNFFYEYKRELFLLLSIVKCNVFLALVCFSFSFLIFKFHLFISLIIIFFHKILYFSHMVICFPLNNIFFHHYHHSYSYILIIKYSYELWVPPPRSEKIGLLYFWNAK